MDKHKLDETVDDILQHYGVKGMKWGVRRASEQSASSNSEGGSGGGGDEEEIDRGEIGEFIDSLPERLEEMIKNLDKKLSQISKDIKKKGSALMEKYLGTSKKPGVIEKKLKNSGKTMQKYLGDGKKPGIIEKKKKDAIAKYFGTGKPLTKKQKIERQVKSTTKKIEKKVNSTNLIGKQHNHKNRRGHRG